MRIQNSREILNFLAAAVFFGIGSVFEEIHQELEDDFVVFGKDFEIGVVEFFAFGFDEGEGFGEVEGGVHFEVIKLLSD